METGDDTIVVESSLLKFEKVLEQSGKWKLKMANILFVWRLPLLNSLSVCIICLAV